MDASWLVGVCAPNPVNHSKATHSQSSGEARSTKHCKKSYFGKLACADEPPSRTQTDYFIHMVDEECRCMSLTSTAAKARQGDPRQNRTEEVRQSYLHRTIRYMIPHRLGSIDYICPLQFAHHSMEHGAWSMGIKQPLLTLFIARKIKDTLRDGWLAGWLNHCITENSADFSNTD